MHKGQIIAGDFMTSIAVFLMVLIIVIPLFNQMRATRDEQLGIAEAETRLAFATDALLKTTGVPLDWNETTVQAIGLATTDGAINLTKVHRFLTLPPSTVRTLLGIGTLHYNFSLTRGTEPVLTGAAVAPIAYYYTDQHTLLGELDGSGAVWDLYYGGSGSPEPSDARNSITGSASAAFDWMIGNASGYRTIIIEHPTVGGGVNLTGLREFVQLGGILLFVGDASILTSTFSMHFASASNTSGLVRDSSFILAPASTVFFNQSIWYAYNTSSDAPLHMIAEHSSVAGAALIGSWHHGIGTIYYTSDSLGFVGNDPLVVAARFIGIPARSTSGPMLNNFVDRRAVVLDSDLNRLALVHMVVGS